jgi:hypothetical protein
MVVQSYRRTNATMFTQPFLTTKKLTFRYNGIDRRLTDVHGEVIHEIIS